MGYLKCPSVPILGDIFNPMNALAFCFMMILSILFLPSFRQSIILTLMSVAIIIFSFVSEQIKGARTSTFGVINTSEEKKKCKENTLEPEIKELESDPIFAQRSEKDIAGETTTSADSLELETSPCKDLSIKAADLVLPVCTDSPRNRQPKSTISTQRRLQRSSSTCELPFKGLGGWSPSTYLARFNRFQILELPSGRILAPNAREIARFENDFFVGSILIMLKTSPPDEVYDPHLKTRLAEFQIQGKFKKKPRGILYMGVELPGAPLRLGLVMGATVKLCLKFASSRISNLHWSLGSGSGEEAPHMVMPIFRAMDLMVKTEPGSEPPQLGTELPESKHNASMRRSGQSPEVPFEVGPTYSFSFHNSFTNFPKWTIDGMPTGPISIRQVIGNTPIHMVVYDLEGGATKHTPLTKRYFLRCQMSYDLKFPLPQLDQESEESELQVPQAAEVSEEADLSDEDPLEALQPIEDPIMLREDDDGASIHLGEELEETSPPEELIGPVSPSSTVSSISFDTDPSATEGDDEYRTPFLGSGASPGGNSFRENEHAPSRNQSFDVGSPRPTPSFPPVSAPAAEPVPMNESPWVQSGSVIALGSMSRPPGHKCGTPKSADARNTFNNPFGVLTLDESKNAGVVRIKGVPTLIRLMRVASYKSAHGMNDNNDPERARAGSGASCRTTVETSSSVDGCDDVPEHRLFGGDVVVVMDVMTGKLLSVSPQETTTAGAVASGMTYGVARSALAVGGGVISIGGRVAGAAWNVGGAIVGKGGRDDSKGNSPSHPSSNPGRNRPGNQQSPTHESPVVPTSSGSARRWRETLIWTSVPVTNHAARVWSGKRAAQREFTIIGVPSGRPIKFGDFFRLGGTGQWTNLLLRIDSLPTLKHGGHLLRLSSNHVRRGSKEPLVVNSNGVSNGALIENLASVGVGTIRVDRASLHNEMFAYYNIPLLSPRAYSSSSSSSSSSLFDLDLWAVACSPDKRHLVSMPTLLPATIKQMTFDAYGMFDNGYFEVDIPAWTQCMNRNTRNIMSAFIVRVRWRASFLKGSETPNSRSESQDRRQIKSFVTLRCGAELSAIAQAFQRIGGKSSLNPPLHSSEAPLKSLKEPDRNIRVLSRLFRKLTFLNNSSAKNNQVASNLSNKSGVAAVRALLYKLLMVPSTLDNSFLRGGAADLGVDGNLISNSSLLPSTSASSVASSRPNRHSSFSSVASSSSSGGANKIIWSSITVRCVWEGHWREEVAVYFISHLALYAPHSKIPSLMILTNDITRCRVFNNRGIEYGDGSDIEDLAKVSSPLSGLPCLVVETIGRCHYLCFASYSLLLQAFNGINEVINSESDNEDSEDDDKPSTMDQSIPRHEVLIDPRLSFILTAARWRGRPRLVLNARKFSFDCNHVYNSHTIGQGVGVTGDNKVVFDYNIAADLLKAALSLKPEPSLKMSKFLDMASALRTLPRLPKLPSLSSAKLGVGWKKKASVEDDQFPEFPLPPSPSLHKSTTQSTVTLEDTDKIDPVSIHLCFWINLYHALLQHALLLLGAPRCQRDWISFHSSISYELFGNVFSLSDIEYCVLRGAAVRSYPVSGCAPRYSPKYPANDDDRRTYAVTPFDPRINFVLHGGVINCVGAKVSVLHPSNLHETLNNWTARTLASVAADVRNRVLVLPQPFGAHPGDFMSFDAAVDGNQEHRSRSASNSGGGGSGSSGSGGASYKLRTGDAMKFCLRHVGRDQWKQLSILLLDWDIAKPPIVQYRPYQFESYDSLTLDNDSDISHSPTVEIAEQPRSSWNTRRSASVDD